MKFVKMRDVKSPERGTLLSAGIDFFVPKLSECYLKDVAGKGFIVYDDTIMIQPQGRVLLPSGIKSVLPHGTMLTAFNKSGIATKLGLVMGACVVDEDYQGEIHLSLINTSNKMVVINSDQKVAQFILVPVLYNIPEEINEKYFTELHSEGTKNKSTRGTGGFGSTGDK